MCLQTATAMGDPVSARSEGSLFITCPKLIGGTFRYARDEEIYGEAGEAKFVYKVVSGAVRSHKLLSDGRRQIGAFYMAGDFFGLEDEVRAFSAEAVTDAHLVAIKPPRRARCRGERRRAAALGPHQPRTRAHAQPHHADGGERRATRCSLSHRDG